jgi:hypothetical protein
LKEVLVELEKRARIEIDEGTPVQVEKRSAGTIASSGGAPTTACRTAIVRRRARRRVSRFSG